MDPPIISVSGLRGIVGVSLSPESALLYACAFAAEVPAGPIVLARDGRATGPMLADAIRGGLAGAGRAVIDAEVAATPTVGVLVRDLRAAGGIQISASHNPAPYNGIKLFGSDGRVVSAAIGESVRSRYEAASPDWVTHERVATATTCDDTLSAHWSLLEKTIDVDRIRKRRFRVVLDSNHGAGSLLGRHLLERLDCRATLLGEVPDGHFDHEPEPTAENLAGVLSAVTSAGADVGFCQDPDADRLAVIDERGRYLGEEYTLALCVDHVLRATPGPVVTNCSTSRMTQDLAERYGAAFYRSRVGEAHVTEAMLAHDAVLGGEGNGGVIDPRVGYVRDSFVGMALVLDSMAATGKPISTLADALPRYEIVKTKVNVDRNRVAAALDAVERHFSEAAADRMDGLRLDWPKAWLLVRASNTEPIVRAIAEAETRAEAERLCTEAAAAMTGQ